MGDLYQVVTLHGPLFEFLPRDSMPFELMAEDMQWHVVNTRAIDWNQKKYFKPSKDINNGFKDSLT